MQAEPLAAFLVEDVEPVAADELIRDERVVQPGPVALDGSGGELGVGGLGVAVMDEHQALAAQRGRCRVLSGVVDGDGHGDRLQRGTVECHRLDVVVAL